MAQIKIKCQDPELIVIKLLLLILKENFLLRNSKTQLQLFSEYRKNQGLNTEVKGLINFREL